MKTYRIFVDNEPVDIAGLTDGVKENIEDIVQARERKKLGRQLKKGLIDEANFTIGLKSVEALEFGSMAVLTYAMMTPEGQRQLIREVVEAAGKQKATDELVDKIHAVYQDTESDTHQIFVRIWGDAYPKKAMKGSGSTGPSGAVAGEPSSAANPST